MTLPFLESASFWASVAVVLFTILAAIAGVFALYFSLRLSAAKDVDLERFKTESAKVVASADARAAEANRMAEEARQGTARALSEAASANERTAKLELEATQQRERAAKAEKDLLELQQRLAWRTVSEEQRRIISQALASYKGQKVTFWPIAGSEEVDRFARHLARGFTDAGITVEIHETIVFGTAKSGLALNVGQNRIVFANAISTALSLAGIIDRPLPAQESSDPDKLDLTIWPKGQ